MAQQLVNIGTTPNDGTGDTLRDAFDKTNDNFTELYALDAADLAYTPTSGSSLSGTTVQAAISELESEKSPLAGNSSLITLGTVTAGVWNGTAITGQYGGTGVNNSGKTITLGGNLTTSGAYALTLTLSNTTSVTLPTSGTLVNTSVTTLSSLSTIGTLASNLLFTDATYDIGASGATRPRDLYLSRAATIGGALTVSGTTTLQQSTEVLNTKTSATGTVTHDFSTGAVFHHSSISANFTANITNVPTTNNRTIVVSMILVQGVSPFIPNALQIDGSAQTIKWQDNTVPTGNASKVDIVSFSLIRTGSAWTVLGGLSTYG
jgi:hypothetical protein